jgi:hypothetical protein
MFDVTLSVMKKAGNARINVTLRRISVLFPFKSEICSHPEDAPVALVTQHAKHKLLNTLCPVIMIIFLENVY